MALSIIRQLAATLSTMKYTHNHNIFSISCMTLTDKTRQLSSCKLSFSTETDERSVQRCIFSQNSEIQEILSQHMTVYPDFITREEEISIFDEVDRYIKRQRYQFDHWDNAIHGYRETEKKNWNPSNQKIIERVRELAFVKDVTPLAYVHVLDIAKEGYIKPHVDAVRFCGDTITGLSISSSCVMRLALESDTTKFGDVFLPQRCLYVMRGRARYEFTHEILKDEESYFNRKYVPRDRRISVICRNEPRHEDTW